MIRHRALALVLALGLALPSCHDEPGPELHRHLPADHLDDPHRQPQRGDERAAELHAAKQRRAEADQQADRHGAEPDAQPDLGQRPAEQVRPAQPHRARQQRPHAGQGGKGGDQSNADFDHRAPWCLIVADFA